MALRVHGRDVRLPVLPILLRKKKMHSQQLPFNSGHGCLSNAYRLCAKEILPNFFAENCSGKDCWMVPFSVSCVMGYICLREAAAHILFEMFGGK